MTLSYWSAHDAGHAAVEALLRLRPSKSVIAAVTASLAANARLRRVAVARDAAVFSKSPGWYPGPYPVPPGTGCATCDSFITRRKP